MEKGFFWIAVIAIGVFIGIFAYDKYQVFQLELATRQALEEIQTQQKNAEEQMRRRSEINQKTEFLKSTLCAINEDTGKCVCIHKKTGMKISKTQSECQAIASKGIRY